MKRGNLVGKVGFCLGRIRSSSTPPPRGVVRALLHQPNNPTTLSPNPLVDHNWSSKLKPNPSAVQLFQRRRLCSSSSNNKSNISLVKSEADFDAALSSIKGGKSPGILYYTAAWCGPCRLIAPIIDELSKKYPHVTTYKVDIDQEGLSSALAKQSVRAVPTFHFFKDGKEAASIVGADVAKLKQTVENLYGN